MCFSQGAPAVSLCVFYYSLQPSVWLDTSTNLHATAEGEVAPRDVLEHVREVAHDGGAGFAPACGPSPRLIQCLLDAGANVNAVDADGWTPLHWACSTGFIEGVVLLLKHGAEVNAMNMARMGPGRGRLFGAGVAST